MNDSMSNKCNVMTTKEKYAAWVDRVCVWMEEVGPKISTEKCGSASAIQSPPAIDGHCKVLFLGHDAHEPYPFNGSNRNRFFEGNKTFKDAYCKWTIWKRPYNSLHRIGHTEIIEPGNFMLMNLFYFGADNVAGAVKNMRKSVMDKCIDFTEELVRDIVKPQVIVCFSEWSVFSLLRSRLSAVEKIQLADGVIVSSGKWYDIPVIGMRHPSGRGVANKYLDTVFDYVVKQIK